MTWSNKRREERGMRRERERSGGCWGGVCVFAGGGWLHQAKLSRTGRTGWFRGPPYQLTRTHTYTRTHGYGHELTHTHTNKHTCTQTHTHIHTPVPSCPQPSLLVPLSLSGWKGQCMSGKGGPRIPKPLHSTLTHTHTHTHTHTYKHTHM